MRREHLFWLIVVATVLGSLCVTVGVVAILRWQREQVRRRFLDSPNVLRREWRRQAEQGDFAPPREDKKDGD